MANSTSATCFLVVVMAIIVCLSMLVGLQGFTRQGDNQLLQDAEMYASTFSNEGFEDDPEGDLDGTDIELEPVEEEADMQDDVGESEGFESRPVIASPRTAVVHEEIIPFDGTEMQTFGSVAL